MEPTQPTTDGERQILRWLMLVCGVIAVLGLTLMWWRGSRECQAQCVAEGATSGALQFRGGGRLNMGAQCRCEGGRFTK